MPHATKKGALQSALTLPFTLLMNHHPSLSSLYPSFLCLSRCLGAHVCGGDKQSAIGTSTSASFHRSCVQVLLQCDWLFEAGILSIYHWNYYDCFCFWRTWGLQLTSTISSQTGPLQNTNSWWKSARNLAKQVEVDPSKLPLILQKRQWIQTWISYCDRCLPAFVHHVSAVLLIAGVHLQYLLPCCRFDLVHLALFCSLDGESVSGNFRFRRFNSHERKH